MWKRIKHLWNLSKKDKDFIDKLSPDYIPDEPGGNAVFIGEGTEAEFVDQENEDKGLKAWLDRLKRL